MVMIFLLLSSFARSFFDKNKNVTRKFHYFASTVLSSANFLSRWREKATTCHVDANSANFSFLPLPDETQLSGWQMSSFAKSGNKFSFSREAKSFLTIFALLVALQLLLEFLFEFSDWKWHEKPRLTLTLLMSALLLELLNVIQCSRFYLFEELHSQNNV